MDSGTAPAGWFMKTTTTSFGAGTEISNPVRTRARCWSRPPVMIRTDVDGGMSPSSRDTVAPPSGVTLPPLGETGRVDPCGR
ncbi:hypothetical protein ACFFX0_16360 [Citricoccus parietis]|uniref:Uncharacterized protein n=1 Tax=Citricoccus parietis TaxID=592307 RepID=A0ABV5G1A0_9MICC